MISPMRQFWVVGGQFEDTGFAALIAGTERVVGPFRDRRQAEAAWSRLASETRSVCTTRYAIAEEAVREPGPAA
jgi:hypothetical protein